MITVDYNNITIDHPQMEYRNAINLAIQWKKFVQFLYWLKFCL